VWLKGLVVREASGAAGGAPLFIIPGGGAGGAGGAWGVVACSWLLSNFSRTPADGERFPG